MLPVIYKFMLDTDFSRVMLYLVALGLVAYSASTSASPRGNPRD